MMRGLPGSGKSTMARTIAIRHFEQGGKSVAICSTDDYHMVDGQYVFQPNNLGRFHTCNQLKVWDFMNRGVEIVIVDNTNIKRKDMKTYIQDASHTGYEIVEEIIGEDFLLGDQDLDHYVQLCFERCTHGVPREAIERMARSFEK